MTNNGTTHDIKICPRCSGIMAMTERLCRHCGFALNDGAQTVTLKIDPATMRPKRKEWTVELVRGALTLHVRGMNHRIPLVRVNQMVIGRVDVESGFTPDFDLSPFGAVDRGVSRAHLMLHYEQNKLYATDLGSANGSFVNGDRLAVNQSTEIKDRDELTLGRLAISVRLSLDEEAGEAAVT